MKLEEIKKSFNKENISIFEVEMGEKIFDTSFDFDHFEDYLKFLLLNNINHVLMEIEYKDADDFIITNSEINEYKDVYSKTFIKTLKEEVKKYNEKLKTLDFSKPYRITLCCIHQNNYFCYFDGNDFEIDGEEIEEPDVMIDNIISELEDQDIL